MKGFDVDPDIRKASTLPSSFYTDERYFILSREKIFARSWHFAGAAADFAQLEPFEILPGFLNEPVVFLKTASGMRCLSNVCTHRGNVLVEKPCSGTSIRCRYHGRRFDLNGKLISMPEFEGVEGFPRPADDLTIINTAANAGFVFASLKPHASFEEFIEGAGECFAAFDPGRLTLHSKRDYPINAHWALYCENYLEGFHIPFVHHSLNEVVDYGRYTTQAFRYSSIQTAYDKTGNVSARYVFIFPNLMFNFYAWGISVNIVKPLTASKTVVEFLTYLADPSKVDEGPGNDLDRVEAEDEAIVESVQKGIRSRYYIAGRYSPTREQGTHHFHRLIAEFIQ